MSTEILEGVALTPTSLILPEEKELLVPASASKPEVEIPEDIQKARTVPVAPELLNRRFSHFPDFKAKAPVLAIRKGGVRKIKSKDGTVKVVDRFKGLGHIQVCNVEVQRCAKAVKSREADIATAEAALAAATKTCDDPVKCGVNPAKLCREKAKERVEIAKIRRDLTVAKFDYMLQYAKAHNLKTLEKRSPEKAKNPEKAKIVIAAAESIKHLDKVKEDYLLAAAVQANGSRSHSAFQKLCESYKWVVTRHARPGATPLETDDAITRGIEGLWDAAKRYNPLRTGKTGKGAIFTTVAYNWVRRNTRARKNADVKPGQYKVSGETKFLISIDGQVNDDDEKQEFSLAAVGSSEMSDSMKYDVAEALSSLDETQQTVLKLHHFDNMSIKQIAGVVNMPVNSVKVLVSQAHVLLQERLAGYMQ
jgi:RNA polymerase sigma factor (sigma-70 family)